MYRATHYATPRLNRKTVLSASVIVILLATIVAFTVPSLLRAQAAPSATPAPGKTAGATAAKDTTPKLTTTALPGRQSWISDRRDFHLGDIVTILVDEYTLTSLDKESNASDDRTRDLGFSTGGGSTKGLNSQNSSASRLRGTDARTNRLTTEMSARVMEIAPNGLIRLEGTKKLNVEQVKITLTLGGWARTQDVTSDNAVQSFRLADANLDYQADGPLGKPKGGIIGRMLGAFWP